MCIVSPIWILSNKEARRSRSRDILRFWRNKVTNWVEDLNYNKIAPKFSNLKSLSAALNVLQNKMIDKWIGNKKWQI